MFCKNCGNELSEGAEFCGNCGTKTVGAVQTKNEFQQAKKEGRNVVLGGLIGGFVIVGIAFAGYHFVIKPLFKAGKEGIEWAGEKIQENSQRSTSSSSNNSQQGTTSAQVELRPRNQILFENVILQYAQEFDKAQNELQESVSRKNRKNAIAALNMGTYIENWVGTIDTLETNTEGKASIKIRLSPYLSVETWNNALSDIFENTLIEMDSELYQVLYNLKKGQRVIFSGSLFKADDDFYKETSLTIRGAMKDSEFLMRFTNIKPL